MESETRLKTWFGRGNKQSEWMRLSAARGPDQARETAPLSTIS